MKTTIDIPDPLYEKAKIRAMERGQSIMEIVITSLESELDSEGLGTAPPAPQSYWRNRRLVPEFARLQAAGAFKPNPGSPDITELISQDRNDRDS